MPDVAVLFLDPGIGACGTAFDQSLKNWCWKGARQSRQDTDQTLSWGGREALSRVLFLTGCSIWREETCWPSAPADPASFPVSPVGLVISVTRSLPIQSSSGRQLFAPGQPLLRPPCTLLILTCIPVSNKPLYFRSLKTKQSCAHNHNNSFCICLFLKIKIFI